MHVQAYEYIVNATMKHQLPDGLVVEIGGRNINGTIRHCFSNRDYISIDIKPGDGVDELADGATYVPPRPPAVVVCCEVLEHTKNAKEICENAFKILKPGGVFLMTAAGKGREPHSASDGGRLQPGEFYRNVTEEDLAEWLEGFERVEIRYAAGPKDIYATAWKPNGHKKK